MEATIFVLHSAFFGFAVCKATSKEVRSSCATCAMGSGDWEVPLKIRWNAQSQDKELSDLIAPDSAESTSSTLVSDRVRRVLENEQANLNFLPVIEDNPEHIKARPEQRPLWWVKVPVLSLDTKKYGWRVTGRPCSQCGNRFNPSRERSKKPSVNASGGAAQVAGGTAARSQT